MWFERTKHNSNQLKHEYIKNMANWWEQGILSNHFLFNFPKRYEVYTFPILFSLGCSELGDHWTPKKIAIEFENYAVIKAEWRRESTPLPSNCHVDNTPSDTTYGLLTTANVKSHSEFLLLEKFAFLFNNKRNWKATKRKKFNLNYNTRM